MVRGERRGCDSADAGFVVAREICDGLGYRMLLWTAAYGVYTSGAKVAEKRCLLLIVVSTEVLL